MHPATRSHRRLLTAPVGALLALGVLLTGCGDDGSDDSDGSGSAVDSPSSSEPAADPSSATTSETVPTDSTEGATTGGTIDLATVETLAQEFLAADKKCPDGSFTETDSLLTTLDEEYYEQASELYSYGCGGLIDQVIYAKFDDPAVAQELLSLDTDAYSNGVRWVAGDVVVAVNRRVETEGKLDVVGFFDTLTQTCGCGATEYAG